MAFTGRYLVVTDTTSIKKISEVVSTSRKNLIINGVTFGNFFNVLLAELFYGNVVRVWPGGRNEIVATGFRGADGIEQAKNGTIYVSSFENGAVWKMDAQGENNQTLVEGIGFQSTADLYLDEDASIVLVPDTLLRHRPTRVTWTRSVVLVPQGA